MIEALTEPFEQTLTQRALVELVVLGAICGPLGSWVLLYRQSYAAESLAHGMLPGLAAAALAGISLTIGALAGILLAAAVVAASARDERIGADTGVGVAVTALFGIGTLLALSRDTPARLGELLFGDLLSVSAADLLTTGALAGLVMTALAVLHRKLLLAAFDPITAAALGSRPSRMQLAVLVILALTVAAAVQALGNLLVVALLIAPAAAARHLASRLPAVLVVSALLAIAAGVVGLYASYYLNVAGGASVALASVVMFAATLAVRSRSTSNASSPPSGSPVEALGRPS